MLHLLCVTQTELSQDTKPCNALQNAAVQGHVSLALSAPYSCDEALYGHQYDGLIFQTTRTNTTFIAHIRASYPQLPIFVIIDNALPAGIADMLDAGADDCHNSAIKSVELLARLRTIRRRIRGEQHQDIRRGRLCLNETQKTIFIDDQPIPFSRKEFELVCLLLKRHQRPTSKEEILCLLYQSDELPEGKAIDVLIHRTRRKFLKFGIKKPFIAQWGVGWKINERAFELTDTWHEHNTAPKTSTQTSIPITGNIHMEPTHPNE